MGLVEDRIGAQRGLDRVVPLCRVFDDLIAVAVHHEVVIALAAKENVIPRPAQQGIVARPAIDHVRGIGPGDLIVAAKALESDRPDQAGQVRSASDRVIALAAVEPQLLDVPDIEAEGREVGPRNGDVADGRACNDRKRVAVHLIAIDPQDIVARTAIDGVIAVAVEPADLVRPVPARQAVIARPALQRVIAALTGQRVVAVAAHKIEAEPEIGIRERGRGDTFENDFQIEARIVDPVAVGIGHQPQVGAVVAAGHSPGRDRAALGEGARAFVGIGTGQVEKAEVDHVTRRLEVLDRVDPADNGLRHGSVDKQIPHAVRAAAIKRVGPRPAGDRVGPGPA